MPRAYSYIRFSTDRQTIGDSLRRQMSQTLAYCERHGLDLDESFRLSDLGVSGFRGKNLRNGALGGFVEAVRQGKIPNGSYMIIESLDRLSRDTIDEALPIFLDIVKGGVNVVTLDPERIHTAESVKNPMGLLEPLFIMARANEESAIKSSRIGSLWEHRRKCIRDGTKTLGKICPWWLEAVEGGYREIPDRVKVVRDIFNWKAEGLGVPTIAARLNAGTLTPKFSKKWNRCSVYKVITSRTAIGEYQPCRFIDGRKVPTGDPVPDFYPAVVPLDIFHRAQDATTKNKTDKNGRKFAPYKRGRTNEGDPNILQGLITNGKDGHTVHVLSRVQHRTYGTFRYQKLVSSGHTDGVPGSDPTAIEYRPFERAFLHFVRELDPKDFIDTGGDLADQIAAASGTIAEKDHQIKMLQVRFKASGKDSDTQNRILDMIEELGNERRQYADILERLNSRISTHDVDHLGEVRTLGNMLEQASDDEAKELRVRIRARIKHLVKGVVIYPMYTGKQPKTNANNYNVVIRVDFRDGRTRWITSDQDGTADVTITGGTPLLDARLKHANPERIRQLRQWIEGTLPKT